MAVRFSSRHATRALDEYLAFRHRFRSLYAFDLDWSKVRDLLARLRTTWEQVEPDLAQIESFLRAVHAGA
ncbi:MAG: hypothetical protein HY744_16595 [Deltaproteobacteria bacterium]|nr:hypothetical protein [Deltaproteobacteria bacterium]